MAKQKAENNKKKAKSVKSKSALKVADKTSKVVKKAMEKGKNSKNNKKKLTIKLSEHTSLKNVNKKKTKGRQPVWVKKFTLEYEEELNKLQIEILKWQKHVIANEERVLLLF